MLRHFVRLHRQSSARSWPQTHGEIAARAVREIETRYAEPLIVQSLAATAGLSSAHLSTLFKRATDLALGDIAQNFGFANQSHLNTALR